MAKIETHIEEKIFVDDAGNVQNTIRTEKTVKKDDLQEPDYIKLYTNMWCEFNNIPLKYRQLFNALAVRMTYANASTIDGLEHGGQLVYVISPTADAIMAECGWKDRPTLARGLNTLCSLGAIRRITRGCYQINPAYAGRGEWLYNPRKNRGGVEKLKMVFEVEFNKKNTKYISEMTMDWKEEDADGVSYGNARVTNEDER